MAIDTAAKRASMLNFGNDDLLPVPSGTFDQGDRQTFLSLYSGLLVSGLTQVADFMMSKLLLIRG
jgi:hypothetical protein